MAETSSRTALLSLPSDTQILITREFAAPKHLVYEALTTPDLIKRWWHAKRGEATVAEVDLRVGGKWRYVMVTHDGMEVAFHGEYRQLVPTERIVHTEVYEGVPGGDDDPALVTTTLSEADGRTTMTQLMEVSSREVRDMIIETGMEDGMQDALDLLEQLAVSLAEQEA
jgi:uncharacterized protein YndB with AHSA1/START domain